jgi:hypothetical protein
LKAVAAITSIWTIRTVKGGEIYDRALCCCCRDAMTICLQRIHAGMTVINVLEQVLAGYP